jgi:hypothetical protein
VKTNARRLLAGSILVAMVALALSGCQVARAGARCHPDGAWGRDRTFVLHCENGRWVRKIMIARFAQALRDAAAPTTSVPGAGNPAPIVTTTTTTSTTTSTTTTSTTTTTLKPAHYVSLDHVTTYAGSVPGWSDVVPGDWAPASDDFRVVAPGADHCANDGDVTPQFTASVDENGSLQLQLVMTWTEDPNGDGPQGAWQCAMAPQLTLALYSSADPNATDLGLADVDLVSDSTQ